MLKGGVILNPDNLDEIIKKYSEALVEMGQTYGGEPESLGEEVGVKPPEMTREEILDEAYTESQKIENAEKEQKTTTIDTKKESSVAKSEDVNTSPAVRSPSVIFPQGEATSSATFLARVFTAEKAYPVPGAKVVVYRGDNIYAFLETNAEGITKTVNLPAFNQSNSLDENNKNQSIDYLADAFAAGFIPQKELLVSSVGGSDIVLDVLLTPEEEGIG